MQVEQPLQLLDGRRVVVDPEIDEPVVAAGVAASFTDHQQAQPTAARGCRLRLA